MLHTQDDLADDLTCREANAVLPQAASLIPLDALQTRVATSASLEAIGLKVSSKTLATKATRGGGPPYRLFSGRALYRWGDVLEWARGLMTSPRHSTSEVDTQQRAA
jgi:hypothetical protein